MVDSDQCSPPPPLVLYAQKKTKKNNKTTKGAGKRIRFRNDSRVVLGGALSRALSSAPKMTFAMVVPDG